MEIISENENKILKDDEYLNIKGFISRPLQSDVYYKENGYKVYILKDINSNIEKLISKDNMWFKILGESLTSNCSDLLEVLIKDIYTLEYINFMLNSKYMIRVI